MTSALTDFVAILGAVMDKDGQLHMGMCKAALDATSCKCAPLRPSQLPWR